MTNCLQIRDSVSDQLTATYQHELAQSKQSNLVIGFIIAIIGILLVVLMATLFAFPGIIPLPLTVSLFVFGLSLLSCGIGLSVVLYRKKIKACKKLPRITSVMELVDSLKITGTYLSRAETHLLANSGKSDKFKEEKAARFDAALKRFKQVFEELSDILQLNQDSIPVSEEDVIKQVQERLTSLKEQCFRFVEIVALYERLINQEADIRLVCIERGVSLACTEEMVSGLQECALCLDRFSEPVTVTEPVLFSNEEKEAFKNSYNQLSGILASNLQGLQVQQMFDIVLGDRVLNDFRSEMFHCLKCLDRRKNVLEDLEILGDSSERYAHFKANIERLFREHTRTLLIPKEEDFRKSYFSDVLAHNKIFFESVLSCLSYADECQNSLDLFKRNFVLLNDACAREKAASYAVELVRNLQAMSLVDAKSYLVSEMMLLESCPPEEVGSLDRSFGNSVRLFLGDFLELTRLIYLQNINEEEKNSLISGLGKVVIRICRDYNLAIPGGEAFNTIPSLSIAVRYFNKELGRKQETQAMDKMKLQIVREFVAMLSAEIGVDPVTRTSNECFKRLEASYNRYCRDFREAKSKRLELEKFMLEMGRKEESYKGTMCSLYQFLDDFSTIEPLLQKKAEAAQALALAHREYRSSKEESKRYQDVLTEVQALEGSNPWQQDCLLNLDYEDVTPHRAWIRLGEELITIVSDVTYLSWVLQDLIHLDLVQEDSLMEVVPVRWSEEDRVLCRNAEELIETGQTIIASLESLGCSASLNSIRTEVHTVAAALDSFQNVERGV